MLIAALASWLSGRVFPGLLALGVALMILMAWRMGTDLVPREIWLQGETMTLLTAGRLITVPIEGATARKLDRAEIEHIERLASAGGIITGTGGFDSHKLREFDLYASDLENALLVHGPGGRMVLTPDEPDAFLAALAG